MTNYLELLDIIRQVLGARADLGSGLTSEECNKLSKAIQYNGSAGVHHQRLVDENLKPFRDDFILQAVTDYPPDEFRQFAQEMKSILEKDSQTITRLLEQIVRIEASKAI